MTHLKRIIFLIFVAVFPVLLAFHIISPKFDAVFSPMVIARPVLIIDAGHGGEDGGAISLSGVPESQLNLAIAQRLDLIMGLYGAPAVMTRRQDISLHDSSAKTLREKKVSDLHNRVAFVSQQSNAVLLSVHQNSFPSGKYSGAQMFYSPTEGSQALAEAMQQTLCTFVDPANNRQAAQIPKTVYFMNHISCPAVLVECGFLTNPTEEARLRTPDYQLKLAAAMAGCWLQRSGLT